MEDPKSNTEPGIDSTCYSVSEKNHLLVVSFAGDLTGLVLPSLEVCRQEITAKRHITCVVLYFQQVTVISTEVVSYLAQLQREIRLKKKDLRLCGLKTNLRERLIKMGVVRGLEVVEDLKSALLSFDRAA